MCKLMGVGKDDIFYDNLIDVVTERVGCESRTRALESLGLLSEDPVEKLGSPLDTLSRHLALRLAYEQGERDMILMRHEVSKKADGFQLDLWGESLLSLEITLRKCPNSSEGLQLFYDEQSMQKLERQIVIALTICHNGAPKND